MNKTSMQMLIDYIKEANERVEPSSDYARGMISAGELIITKAIELRDTVEREQIIEAYLKASDDYAGLESRECAESHYTQTYQSK